MRATAVVLLSFSIARGSAVSGAAADEEKGPQAAEVAVPGRVPASATASAVNALRTALEGGGPHTLDVSARVLAFPAAEGKVFLAVPFLISGARPEAPPLEIVAGLVAATSGKLLHGVLLALPTASSPSPDAGPGGPSGAVRAPPGSAVRSFAFLADPGTYRLAIGVRERGGETVLGSAVVPAVAPVFADGGLHVSQGLLARGIDVVAGGGAVLDRVVDRVRVGNLSIDAGLENRLTAGSTPELVYFLSGVRPGPDGALDVAADYRILRRGAVVLRFPTQTVTGKVTSQPIPTTGLPPGEYLLELKLADRLGGKQVSGTVPFVLE